MTFDGKALGVEIVGAVKEYLAREISPLQTRIDDLHKRIDALPQPVDYGDEIKAVKSAVDAIVIPDAPVFPDFQEMIEIAVDKAVATIPPAKDGKSVTVEDLAPLIAAETQALKDLVNAIEIPEPLPLPVLPDVKALVDEAVKAAVAAIPAPKDGKSITVEDVAPFISSEIEKRISELPQPRDGKDGLDVSDLFRAEGGKLIAVMSDGRTKDLGVFVGKDGLDGEDGKDGIGFDDLSASYDGEKRITFKFARGEQVKEFSFSMPVVIDRGVYREGGEYKAGDGVTWGGSFWIAQQDTSAKPDGSSDWRLAVKRGRDGKDGVVKGASPNVPVRVGTPSKGA